MKTYAIAEWEGDEHALVARVTRLSESRVDFVQLRAKQLGGRALYDLALLCRSAVSQPSRLIINTRADVALAIAADGVHLTSDGMPVAAARRLGIGLVGRSCHSVEDVRKAASEHADYVLFGPVFPTRSKASERLVTPAQLAEAASFGVPVFALGGVSMHNLGTLQGAPVEGVAAITLFMKDEPLDAVLEAVRKL